MADFVDAPAPTTPDTDKLPVIDFDFRNDKGEIAAQVTVWPSLGDEWFHTPDGFRFVFKRIKTEQTIFKHLCFGMSMVESMRKPFTREEFERKMREATERKKANNASPA